MWGGGGAGSFVYWGSECCMKHGGGGGYISGLIHDLDIDSIKTLKVEVGRGGIKGGYHAGRAWPDGGRITGDPYDKHIAGNGGASSRIYDANVNDPEIPYAVAGGGGGGGFKRYAYTEDGTAGGGCLQWTPGKSNEPIDGYGDYAGIGGEQSTRYGQDSTTTSIEAAGGGGYRGGGK
eukprot:3321771-Rhodomonas_salina.1